ncbi:hypothetical protein CNBA3040 [Cryptococcus deneoformans B-3501A]|uniref:hypothetical protein n=1 Tax=Cryptococcus deneoformans (strain B-3501A) TaxID=283643 RepID=UPI000042F736|nr:hypothetical protein CNBA3040 [Cryptococcus neoformans var. neoformans B-3501A]EAL23657.1 hypothetical protein CNBA3040 [Cryptococcus neoformans var. neoformans B-3501A]
MSQLRAKRQTMYISNSTRMKNKVQRAKQSRKIQGRDEDPSQSTSLTKGIDLHQLASPPPKLLPKPPTHDIPIAQDAQETRLHLITQRLPILSQSPPISVPPQPSDQSTLHSTTRPLHVPKATPSLSAQSLGPQPLQSIIDQAITPEIEHLALNTQSQLIPQSDPSPTEPSGQSLFNLTQQQFQQKIPLRVTPLPTYDQSSFIPISAIPQDVATYNFFSAEANLSDTTKREPQAFFAHTDLVNIGSAPSQSPFLPNHTSLCDSSSLESLFSPHITNSDINSCVKRPETNTGVETWDGQPSSRGTEIAGLLPVKDVAIADGSLTCDQLPYATAGGTTGFSSLALFNDGLVQPSEGPDGLSQIRDTKDGISKTVPAWYGFPPGSLDQSYVPFTATGILTQGVHSQDLKRKAEDPPLEESEYEIYTPPGNIQAAMDGWWNWILAHYDKDKHTAMQSVVRACNSFFANAHIWLNFFNKSLFFSSLFSQASDSNTLEYKATSLRAAPHVLLSILSLVTLLQKGHTPEGQQLALLFQREAQSILNYCISAGSQDPSLVAAAIVIATFEMQPHVEHTTDRLVAAVLMLDGIGLSVFSSRLDADDVRVSTSITGLPRLTHSNVLATTAREREVQLEPSITKWAQVPAWANHWSAGDIWKEEMRRMLWAASSISATLSLWLFMVGKSSYNLEISHPERFRLFFPGEMAVIEAGDGEQGKTTPWALYHRLISLWHFIVNNQPLNGVCKLDVVRELQAVEDDIQIFIDAGVLKIYIWQSADWAMFIRRVLGVMDSQALRRWFRNEITFFKALAGDRPGVPGVRQRPLYAWWYVMQVSSALELSRMRKEFWEDSDLIYNMTLAGLDQVIKYWNCQNVLGPYFVYLQHKYRTVLEERQRLLHAEAQGRVQDLYLEQLKILRAEAEGQFAKIQNISEYRNSKLYY